MLETILALLPLLGSAGSAQDGGDAGRLLTDFDQAGLPLAWTSVNDTVMGGRSRGSFRIADGTLRFQGALNTDGGGFASLRTRPVALALKSDEGLRLRVRGDGRVFTMRLQQRGRDGRRSVSYRATFPTTATWQDVWLPFRSFVPVWRGRVLDLPAVDPGRVDGLGLMIADGIDGAFRLEVDSIHAYPPFSLADFAKRRRPLVVFAPRDDDPRLERQLVDVRESLAEFHDRDMVLLVVLEEGVSRADRRPLAAAATQSLRRRFEMAEGEFAVVWIGKDGEVVRRAAEPMALPSVYAQIDATAKPPAAARRRDPR